MASAPVFRTAPERNGYEVVVDDEVVGVSTYRDVGGRRILVHTQIDEPLEGHGLGTRLIEFAIEDISRAGLQLVPQCPMVAAYIETHPEWADLVGEPGR